MKKIICLLTLFIVGSLFVFASGDRMQDIKALDLKSKKGLTRSGGGVKPDLNFGKIPLYFIVNKGQVNPKAAFYAKASRYTLWLTKEGLVFDSFKRDQVEAKAEVEGKNKISHSTTHPKVTRDVSRLHFLNAYKKPEIVPINKTQLRVNYFKGNDKSKWHCDIPTSLAVLYKSLYKNIDLKVYGLEKQIEYDWIVKAGGDPGDIKFEYKNVKGTRIDEEGNLLIETDFGELIHKKPVSYQEKRMAQSADRRAEKTVVDVKFKKIAENIYGFEVGAYDSSRELIIDPVVLAYSTYLGGELSDYIYDIAVDSGGNVYVIGHTYSTNFPTLNQYQGNQTEVDVFVTKLDTTQSGATSLIYSTYLGGRSPDHGIGIAVDTGGNAYVTGWTNSTNFPVLNQYQADQPGYDAFVTVLDTTQSGASSLIYSTYLGGLNQDRGLDIAVDAGGNAYVTGYTTSTDFPTLNQYQTDPGDSDYDAFVTMLDPTRNGAASLLYSTYLGGGDWDSGVSIAVDAGGSAYVTGYTDSSDFPILNRYQPNQLNRDVFVTMLDPTQSGASSLIYSTYLGGEYDDYGYSIAVDTGGNVYVTGYTYSPDFPTLNQYQAETGDASSDVFVTMLDPTQSGFSSLLYSTYLGGGHLDYGTGIAVDTNGNVYVTGYTESTNFPTLNQYQGDQGSQDVFVTKLDPTQSGASSLIYSTYLGGGDNDRGFGIAIDAAGNVYVAGDTTSTDFPTLDQYQGDQGILDAFVTKLTFQAQYITATSPNGGENWNFGSTQNITWESTGVSAVLKITLWKDGASLGIIADNIDPAAGTYFWTVGQYTGGNAAPGTGYMVKIKEKGTTVADVSDAPFTISPSLTVTSPNGGEDWKAGTAMNITWNAPGVSGNVKITLYKDGVFVGLVTDGLDPAAGTYSWTVGQYSGGTAAPGTGYTIKIKEKGTTVADVSDAPFIISPSLTVTSPNGGENWTPGTTMNIAWNAQGVSGDLKITLYKDGVFVGRIADGLDPAAGTYPWTVGQYAGGTAAPGTGYTVKIKEKGTTVADTGDAPFTLTD